MPSRGMRRVPSGSRAALVLAALASSVAGGQRAAKPDGWRWVPVPHVQARLAVVPDADAGRSAVQVSFVKQGGERRLLALETMPERCQGEPKALVMRCRLTQGKGQPPRLALVVYERDGGAWFTIGRPLVPGERFAEARLPVSRLRQAAFGSDADGKLAWDALAKCWLGLAFDTPAEGVIEISQARFTDEPYRPTQPLAVRIGGPARWSLSKDRAVRGTLTTPDEGPDGRPCMKFQFSMPGRRHMYAIPYAAVPDEELEGYRALRFAYKARLPRGIPALFVALTETGGGQYYNDQKATPAAGDWKTITIAFTELKLGGWSRDSNGRLDLEDLRSVNIGCHGTATEATNHGVIWVADIEFVP